MMKPAKILLRGFLSALAHIGYRAVWLWNREHHFDELVALCEQVDSPRVKVLYDIYHMQIMEGDVIRTICDNIRWIGHFHTAGVPGRQDIDDSQELHYGAICEAIAATGYDLYVGHEFRPKGDALEALRKVYAICNKNLEFCKIGGKPVIDRCYNFGKSL